MAEADPRLSIGGNNPPPRELHALHIEELMEQAQGFLDGEPIANQAQADAIGTLLGMLRQAKSGAEEQRKIEAKPFDDGKAEVQAFWIPLKGRIELAEDIAKKALAPFLAAEEARKQAEAARAREQARRAQRAAQEALQAASTPNLAAREEAERLLTEANKADKAANRAEKAKPMAAGLGRSVSLRSRWTATLTDSAKALSHYRERQPEELREWLREQAQRDVNGGARDIPGFSITEERIAQ
jgi:hypothetical protein